jgi:Antirestriction protein (ArdA)
MSMTDGTEPITTAEDIIDSRDVIARIEYLEDNDNAPHGWTDDETDELESLRALRDEASGYTADWENGETLIRDGYFATYARDLAEDCGMVKPDAVWPVNHIDWEAAADDLKMDYTSVTFDGVDYWIR